MMLETMRYFFETNIFGDTFYYAMFILVLYFILLSANDLSIDFNFIYILAFVGLLAGYPLLPAWIIYIVILIIALVVAKLLIEVLL